MQAMTVSECLSWCRENGLAVDGRLPSSRVRMSEATEGIRILTAGTPESLIELAYMIVATPLSGGAEDKFEGALLWLQRWELWSESIDRVGYMIFRGLRGEPISESDLARSPGHLFTRTEFAEAQAFLSVPMLFRWDAHFVVPQGNFLAFTSHEGHVDLFARTAETHRTLAERFKDWHPVPL